jgi:enoyl-CoA hydratase
MINCRADGRTAWVTIDRPDKGNAFTSGMVRDLRGALQKMDKQADILVLQGAGDDFSLGRDREEPKSGSPFDAFSLITDLNQSIADFSGLVISGVKGRAYGLGMGLVMRSDLAVASQSATFMLDEVKLGIPPMFIMAAIFDHLAPKQALDAILTSREISSAEALDAGIVSRVVSDADFSGTMTLLVEDLLARDRDVLLACKRYAKAVVAIPPAARPAFALVEQTNFARMKH